MICSWGVNIFRGAIIVVVVIETHQLDCTITVLLLLETHQLDYFGDNRTIR
jgi:hypothetical protein